ncbi:MAG TPA: DUF1289 domain-containing protein [Azonexus sp.]|nr:DUF1289 domain-containing protein [Azonexus sp.]
MPALPASPCTNVCRIDPVSGFCVGCRRSLDEIANWSRLDAPARLAVLAALRDRQAASPRPTE